jgi:hypothetical protein
MLELELQQRPPVGIFEKTLAPHTWRELGVVT